MQLRQDRRIEQRRGQHRPFAAAPFAYGSRLQRCQSHRRIGF
ncbi:MAG TPA: hypothetical protein VES39_04575 [Rhodospirillales bacterium]|nr:hypothetical protein [Rhodospirillales bacterium]